MATSAQPPLSNPLEKCLGVVNGYQIFIMLVVAFSKTVCFWHVMNLLFIHAPMKYTCNGVVNDCPCDNPVWDRSVFTQTFQSKFGIICKKDWLTTFSKLASYIGIFFGALASGFVSDKYGRLFAFAILFFIISLSGMLLAFMSNVYMFILMRFWEGFGCGGAIVVGYVLFAEYCSTKNREFFTSLYSIPLPISQMTLPGVSYIYRDMDDFQIALSIPAVALFFLCYYMRESPKWLMDNNKLERLEHAFQKICPKCENIMADVRSFIDKKRQAGDPGADAKKDTFWDIFKYRHITINFACMTVVYFAAGLGYYGVVLLIGKLQGSIHMNVFLSGLFQAPSVFIVIFLLKVLSRRNLLIVSNVLAGGFLIVEIFSPATMPLMRVSSACCSNLFFFIDFIVMFLYAVELFPTSVRSSVLGILNVWCRLGQMFVPPVNDFLSPTAATTTYIVSALLSALLCLPLPDTKGLELPATLEDSVRTIKLTQERRASRASRASRVT